MNPVKWFREKFSSRGKSVGIYKRGMKKAENGDPNGAIADYSEVIKMPDTPNDVIAMALFNRGLVYVANGDTKKGNNDLQKVLDMDSAPTRVKDMAKQKMIRMQHSKKTYEDI